MQQSSLPAYFKNKRPDLFNSWFNLQGADALTVSLNLPETSWIDKVVVGVDSTLQLRSLIDVENLLEPIDFPQLGCDDANLINPAKWKLM